MINNARYVAQDVHAQMLAAMREQGYRQNRKDQAEVGLDVSKLPAFGAD